MQGYPFGMFLFWRVAAETSDKFKFYGFVRDYHQRDAAHCPELGTLHHQSVTAVLDGQQRLTALDIGLRDSMAMKQANRWWTSDDAFPKRTLRLNLLARQEGDENGVVYRFKFFDDQQAERSDKALWFSVSDVPKADDVIDLNDMIIDAGLTPDAHKSAKDPGETLSEGPLRPLDQLLRGGSSGPRPRPQHFYPPQLGGGLPTSTMFL